ncbi:MAG: TIGR00282 family metallophosphoesterase [Chitinivibrionales bacterium]
MPNSIRVLFVGDIFGSCGKRVLSETLEKVKQENEVELCIANGENLSGGIGITWNGYRKLRKFGVDVVTGGNHSFAKSDIWENWNNNTPLLRPHNYPPGNPGSGKHMFDMGHGINVGIINLQGRTFFQEFLDCPFRVADEVIENMHEITNIIIVDFHAEATSEKSCLGKYLDGRVSAVLGTHTHIQTSDERVFSGGTGFITDAGFTGAEDSAIGMKYRSVIDKYIYQTKRRFEPAKQGPVLNGVLLDIDTVTGNTLSISRIYKRINFND